jgi:biopolymer transport protein ExbD
MRLERPARSGRLIGLTPLVDVVFILLVFFMLASTLDGRQGLAVGAAPQGRGEGGEGAVLVRLHERGMDVAGRPVPPDGLRAALAPRLAADPDLPVLIRAGEAVALDRLVAAMDAAAAAGARSIAVAGGAGR